MEIHELVEILKKHNGQFLCEGIGNESNTKLVKFEHIIEGPIETEMTLNDAKLKEFYLTMRSLTLFYCEEGEEAAFYISHPSGWESLEEGFEDWVEMLEEDEQEDCLPKWFGEHQVIGEIPGTGNYLLTVTAGNESGAIYSFDHDGFEFEKLGDNINDFIRLAISPNSKKLMNMASHMRFISGNTNQQWWLKELQPKLGETVVTE